MITGAKGDAGRALADAFARSGADLALAVRRVGDVAAIDRQFALRGQFPLMQVCDLRYEEDIVRMVHRVVRRFGRIDAVINAGSASGPRLRLVDYPVEPWRNVLATNLTGTFLVCREVLPWMERQGGGSIINVIQTGGREVGAANAIACRAIEGLTQQLAVEAKALGVRVNAVDLPLFQPAEGLTESDGWTETFVWLVHESSAAATGRRISTAEYQKTRLIH